MYSVLVLLLGLTVAEEPTRFLIVSQPRFAKILYVALPGGEPRPLIDSGLKSPQGLAIDERNQKLYVADPDSRKIFSYQLQFTNGVLMTDEKQMVAAQNIEARWVAVDGVGNIFFSDETANVIQKVSATNLLRGVPTPDVVYDGKTTSNVMEPGGVAVDNFRVFWTNKAMGPQAGSVVQGKEDPADNAEAADVHPISRNAQKVYGVCLSQNNVYYTDSQKFLYGVKKNGGAIATVSDKLLGPRGCAWDGDGTVFVADKSGNAVYSFPGNMHTLAPAQLTKAVDVEDAYGLAVIQSASSFLVSLAAFLGLLTL